MTESRIFTILHVAIHDAVNAIDRRHEPYRAQTLLAPGASIDAAIAAAAHATLTNLMPAANSTFDAVYEEALLKIADGEAKQRGLEIGRQAAATILVARKNDGSNRTVTRAPGTKPGEYRPTPPDFTPAFFAHWGNVTPFVLKSPAQFRPVPPPAVKSAQALADLKEVKTIGAEKSATRTDEQSEIARFWYENSTLGWNRITREVAIAQQLDVVENARLFALVNLAMADGFIGGFEAKYHYNYWRPASAIREAGDSLWINYLWTPPVPDYPSTHTVLGASAAAVLERFFGTDFVNFTMTSGAPYPGITRKFWSFSEAARENGASRVLAGIHFSTAVNAGYLQGSQIGTLVFEQALRPVVASQAVPTSTASVESSR
jgi:membrane-associated phospholipid phosphatase/methionine-rich copper-binding protein CopC